MKKIVAKKLKQKSLKNKKSRKGRKYIFPFSSSYLSFSEALVSGPRWPEDPERKRRAHDDSRW